MRRAYSDEVSEARRGRPARSPCTSNRCHVATIALRASPSRSSASCSSASSTTCVATAWFTPRLGHPLAPSLGVGCAVLRLIDAHELLDGPLGEEPGFRGYAVPHLQAERSPLAGGAVLAGLAALWHLPIVAVGALPPDSAVLTGITDRVRPDWHLALSDRQEALMKPWASPGQASGADLAVRLPLEQATAVLESITAREDMVSVQLYVTIVIICVISMVNGNNV